MTREEAIKIINCYDIGFYDLSGEKIPADKLAEAFDMAIEALSADGVGRYENAMQKLREMPKYLNGVKEKQIKKISANEVVLCKDCRHANECHKSVQYTRNELNTVTIGYTKIDFCSHGERREP